ncbi:hypothetical protein [Acinetobacter sp.]|uniref:hypothetical protein n=1 Tax=Acinetobacter sp. TaxID=472 RepID=UPI002FCAD7F5
MGKLQNVEKIEQQSFHEKTWFKRHCPAISAASAAVGSMAVASSANAAGLAASILEKVTGEVTAIGNSQEAIYGLLIVVLVGFLIWRYSKRTVNSG